MWFWSSASSVVFELHGNTYPVRRFYIAMNIREPAKPYFLDVDTGGGAHHVAGVRHHLPELPPGTLELGLFRNGLS